MKICVLDAVLYWLFGNVRNGERIGGEGITFLFFFLVHWNLSFLLCLSLV